MRQRTLRILALAALLVSARTASAESILRGTIRNTSDGTIFYYGKEPVIERWSQQQDFKLVDGSFELHFNNIDPVKITVSFDQQLLAFFLMPGDSISFSCDGKDPGHSLQIKSNNQDDQLYMTGMSLIEALKLQGMAPYELKGVGWQNLPDGLTDSLDRVMNQQKNIFSSSQAKTWHLSQALQRQIIDTTYKHPAALLIKYALQTGASNMKLSGDTLRGQDIDSLLAHTELENEALIGNNDYMETLYWYDTRLFTKDCRDKGLKYTETKDWSLAHMAFQDKLYKSPKIRYAMQTYVLCKNCGNNPDALTAGVAELNQKYPDGHYHDQLEKIALSAGRLKAGEQAPPFVLKDIKGKSVSLESMKGKVVYIDFWATWCAPCVMENKAAKKIKPKYKDKDIVFVYIIRDNNEDAWKEAVAKQEIEGLHLFGAAGNVFEQYHVNGVPHYVLIDKAGKIVTAEAPRPSDTEKLTGLIDQQLAK